MRNWLFWFFAIGLTAYCVLNSNLWESSPGEPGSTSPGEIAAAPVHALAVTPDPSQVSMGRQGPAPDATPLPDPGLAADGSVSLQALADRLGEEGDGADPVPASPSRSPLVLDQLARLEEQLEGEVPGGAREQTPQEVKRQSIEALELALQQDITPTQVACHLSQAIRLGGLSLEEEDKAYEMLQAYLRRSLLNPRETEASFRIRVEPGDSLWTICKRVRSEGHPPVAAGLIRLVNGMSGDTIYVGQNLKVPTTPIRIEVDKGRYHLDVLLGDVLIQRFKVGLGRDNRTPEGDFVVATREKEPTWYMPGEGPVPFGDPRNVLGTRWLGFAPRDDMPNSSQFGIHGTWEDDSIGKNRSEGCVRMRNAEIEQLFELIPEGTRVHIRP